MWRIPSHLNLHKFQSFVIQKDTNWQSVAHKTTWNWRQLKAQLTLGETVRQHLSSEHQWRHSGKILSFKNTWIHITENLQPTSKLWWKEGKAVSLLSKNGKEKHHFVQAAACAFCHSALTYCTTARYVNCSAADKTAFQRAINTDQDIIWSLTLQGQQNTEGPLNTPLPSYLHPAFWEVLQGHKEASPKRTLQNTVPHHPESPNTSTNPQISSIFLTNCWLCATTIKIKNMIQYLFPTRSWLLYFKAFLKNHVE